MATKKKLVIMESPTKTKTIKQYLGDQYEVLSTAGHIVELSKSKGTLRLGFDVESFVAYYRIIKGKKTLIITLQKAVAKASDVYLATDPDREGEAIAYHLQQQLALKSTTKRVLFDDLSKTTILKAFANPQQLNLQKIAAQETRRILDRIIGFRLSYLLSKKTPAKSAGRVQSVALDLIAQNEVQRQAFQNQEYWTLTVTYQDHLFEYVPVGSKEEVSWDTLKQVMRTCDDRFTLQNIKQTTIKNKPPLPFSTSTFLQTAGNQLHLSPARAMMLLQQLYEGVTWTNNSQKALITYPRTDSKRFNSEFIRTTQQYIMQHYGSEYVASAVNFTRAKKQEVKIQDAHEAIRILDPTIDLTTAKKHLSASLFKVYELLYTRTLGALMTCSITERTTYHFHNNNHVFKTTMSKLIFAGYTIVKPVRTKTENVSWEKGFVFKVQEALAEQHFTQPVNLYSEASLIKTLEEFGIGRPSTYAMILNILVKRGYVTKQQRVFQITPRGLATNSLLQEWFHSFINVNYTAKIERQLDDIAYGKNDVSKEKVLYDCWHKINDLLEKAFAKIPDKEVKYFGSDCPECTKPLVYRESRYGIFLGCLGFPKCRYVRNIEETDYGLCPQCQTGKLQLKTASRNRKFYGCSLFRTTKCNYIAEYKAPPTEKKPKAPKLLKRRCALPYKLLEQTNGK